MRLTRADPGDAAPPRSRGPGVSGRSPDLRLPAALNPKNCRRHRSDFTSRYSSQS